MDVRFFASAADLRAWLEEHHATEKELWVGFYKKGSGKTGVTYPEAVDQALCFGWIDGIRKGVDDISYTNRFTPRKRGSNWSSVNTKRVGELAELGLMHPAGQKVFDERDREKADQYSYEARSRPLAEHYEAQFHANPGAWAFFQDQPPSYRTAATWWVMSAKQEATRLKRLATLIDDSANGRRIAMLARPARGRED